MSTRNNSDDTNKYKSRRTKGETDSQEQKKEDLSSMEEFKMEAANEMGIDLKKGYNGDLTAKEAGSIGGRMVKKMIESYKDSLK